jgi:hypothetical protein
MKWWTSLQLFLDKVSFPEFLIWCFLFVVVFVLQYWWMKLEEVFGVRQTNMFCIRNCFQCHGKFKWSQFFRLQEIFWNVKNEKMWPTCGKKSASKNMQVLLWSFDDTMVVLTVYTAITRVQFYRQAGGHDNSRSSTTHTSSGQTFVWICVFSVYPLVNHLISSSIAIGKCDQTQHRCFLNWDFWDWFGCSYIGYSSYSKMLIDWQQVLRNSKMTTTMKKKNRCQCFIFMLWY